MQKRNANFSARPETPGQSAPSPRNGRIRASQICENMKRIENRKRPSPIYTYIRGVYIYARERVYILATRTGDGSGGGLRVVCVGTTTALDDLINTARVYAYLYIGAQANIFNV